MRRYAALLYDSSRRGRASARYRPAPIWRRALWRFARWLHERSPALAQRLGRIRRKLLPHLYPTAPAGGDARGSTAARAAGAASAGAAGGAASPGALDAAVAEAPKPTFTCDIERAEVPLPSAGVVHYIGSLQAGGAERQAVYSVAGLARRGIRTALVVSEGLKGNLGHYLGQAREAGVAVRWAGEHLDPRFLDLLERHPRIEDAFQSVPPYLRMRVADAAAEFLVMRPRIVHCWLDHTNVWGGVAAALAGVERVVLSGRNVSPIHFPHLMEPWFRDWYLWLLARPGVHLINNSNAGARDYAEWLGIPVERVGVILNGLDVSTIRRPSEEKIAAARLELRRTPSDRVVIAVARLSDEKQPFVFVEVARRVCERRPDVIFALVGEGVLLRKVREKRRAHGLKKRLLLLGRRQDGPALLSASDIFLLTSRAEGTPNVLLETQQLGCPPVSTKAGGAVDAVIDGQTGFLADVGDIDTLTDRVLRLLDDEALRRRMSERGPSFVAERFGLDRMVDETVALYEKIDPDGSWRNPTDRW